MHSYSHTHTKKQPPPKKKKATKKNNRNKSKKVNKTQTSTCRDGTLKKQPNKMGMTPQYFYTIPTSCAIWPTMYNTKPHAYLLAHPQPKNECSTSLPHNITHPSHTLTWHYKLTTVHFTPTCVQDNTYHTRQPISAMLNSNKHTPTYHRLTILHPIHTFLHTRWTIPATLSSNKVATISNTTYSLYTTTHALHTHATAFHVQDNPLLHTTNMHKHSWQNGTRCRDGVKVLWCHSHLIGWFLRVPSLHVLVCVLLTFCDFFKKGFSSFIFMNPKLPLDGRTYTLTVGSIPTTNLSQINLYASFCSKLLSKLG